MNKANCSTCSHKLHPDGGYCYMFKTEPVVTCQAHTGHRLRTVIPSSSDSEFKRIVTDMLNEMFPSI